MTIDNDAAALELALFIDNDHRTYQAVTLPVFRNLYKHYQRGRFDHGLAVRGAGHAVTFGAKRYHAEHCGGGRWCDVFPKRVRDIVAVGLVDQFLTLLSENDGDLGWL